MAPPTGVIYFGFFGSSPRPRLFVVTLAAFAPYDTSDEGLFTDGF